MQSTSERKRIGHILTQGRPGEHVLVDGWVRTRRDSKGGFSFIEVNDGSSLKNLQVVADRALPNYESDVLKLQVGACVSVAGELVASPGKGQSVELKATALAAVGPSDASYPLQKKGHSLEFLRTIAHLRPRTNTFGAVMRVRNALAAAVHEYFQGLGFLYVHTPIITASDAEGAGAMFLVTTLDPNAPPRVADGPRAGQIDWGEDFFGQKTYLTVSGQLEGETYAMALGNIYTFGPTFRAENSNTSRHLAEFWMIEPEMSFADLDANAELAEGFLKAVLSRVLERCADDVAFLDQRQQPGLRAMLESVVGSPFERMTYTEGVKRLLASGETFEVPVKWGDALQTEHERWLTEKLLRKPLILTDYPAEIAAFYMRLNDDGKTVRNMDVLVPQIGEIIGGSQREERYDVLLERMKAKGLKVEDYWWYVELRKYGTAPHAGFGLGFERLVQYATGMSNIRDVIPYPRYPKHAEF